MVKAVAEKVLVAPKVKDAGLEALADLLEADVNVVDTLVEVLTALRTNPGKRTKGVLAKQIAGTLGAVEYLLRTFGPKKVAIAPSRPIAKEILAACENGDRAVRQAGNGLLVELYRWLRTVDAFTGSLPAAQMKEVLSFEGLLSTPISFGKVLIVNRTLRYSCTWRKDHHHSIVRTRSASRH